MCAGSLTWPVILSHIDVEGKAHVFPFYGLGISGGGEVHVAQPSHGAGCDEA